MTNNKNYYEILGVSEDASFEEIQKKYRDLVKKYHPDLCNEEDKTFFEEKIKEINIAYDTLNNSKKRASYDRNLKENNNQNYVYEEEYDYEKEIHNFTEAEKKFAKKLALEKIIEDTILKINIIKDKKYEILNSTLTNPSITDDIYLDNITEWWTLTEKYKEELEELKLKADVENVTHMIDSINVTINSLNDELREVPLSVLDARNDLENKNKKQEVLAKIISDYNLYKEELNNKHCYDQMFYSEVINKDNYNSFRKKTNHKLRVIKNELANMVKLGTMYKINDELLEQISLLIKAVDDKSSTLPKDFYKAQFRAASNIYKEKFVDLKRKAMNFSDKMSNITWKMQIRVGNIVTLTEMEEITNEYKSIMSEKSQLDQLKDKFCIRHPEYDESLIDNLEDRYNSMVKYREEHIEQFFEIFNRSISKKHLVNVMIEDNFPLTVLCLLDGFGAGLSIITKNFHNLSIPSFAFASGINILISKQKLDIYRNNYKKGMTILNNSEETKEEYKEYCLRKNKKNKSTF